MVLVLVVASTPRLESEEGAPRTAHGKANKAAAIKERILKTGKDRKGGRRERTKGTTTY